MSLTYGQKAVELFKTGLSCAQAVTLALAPKLGMDENAIKAISAPFGGGFSRAREVCGAVSGMLMVIGYAHPELSKSEIYAISRQAMEEFKEKLGSYVCRDLLGLRAAESPVPEERTATYYAKRGTCLDGISLAADLADKYSDR